MNVTTFETKPSKVKINGTVFPVDETATKTVDPNAIYMNARQEWNERYGDYIAREHQWKKACFLMGAITLIAVSALAYNSSQSKFVPYVVAVDKLGSAVGVQRADVAEKPDARIIRAQLAKWIEGARTVYQDAGANRVNIENTYSMLHRGDAAFAALNAYLEKHDPFKRAKSENVSVQINSVLPISNDTWQVQWTEEVQSTKGETLSTIPYTANLTIATSPPSEEAILLKNPMGVYVTNFNWSQRL